MPRRSTGSSSILLSWRMWTGGARRRSAAKLDAGPSCPSVPSNPACKRLQNPDLLTAQLSGLADRPLASLKRGFVRTGAGSGNVHQPASDAFGYRTAAETPCVGTRWLGSEPRLICVPSWSADVSLEPAARKHDRSAIRRRGEITVLYSRASLRVRADQHQSTATLTPADARARGSEYPQKIGKRQSSGRRNPIRNPPECIGRSRLEPARCPPHCPVLNSPSYRTPPQRGQG